MTQPISAAYRFMEIDMSTRMYRVTNNFNEALYLSANEPSLGMYRIQEHVAVNIPKIVEQKQVLQDMCQQVEGACFDMEYDTQALSSMGNITQFASIRDSLRSAIELKARLDEAEAQRKTTLPQSAQPPSSTSSLRRDYGSISQNPPTAGASMFLSLDGKLSPNNMLGFKETDSSVHNEEREEDEEGNSEDELDRDPDIKPKSFDWI